MCLAFQRLNGSPLSGAPDANVSPLRYSMDKKRDMADKGLANEVKGAVKETIGKVRGDLGDALDNPSEHVKGRAQQAEGNVQKNFGKAEQKIDEKLKHDTKYTDDGAKKY